MASKVAKWMVCAAISASLVGPALAAGQPKKDGAPAAANLMAKVPMKLGYYVNVGETCSRPNSVMKFGPSSVWTINGDGTRDEQKFVSVSGEGAGYSLNFPPPRGGWEEQDPQAMMVQPKGPGRIDVTIQDTASMQYCAPHLVPAKFKK